MLRLKNLRLERHLSQRALAQKIGSSQKAVDFWEKGLSEPTAGFIIALADCLQCSVDYLLGREDDFGNVNVDADLSEGEKALLNLYRGLPEKEQAEFMRFGEFIRQKSSDRK